MSKLTYRNEIEPTTLINQPEDIKLTEEKDAKNPNTSDFKLTKEDHTVANMLRMKLHTNPQVKFAGYRVPHPTMHTVVIKIQTAPDRPTTTDLVTPAEALQRALTECMNDLDEFDAQVAAQTQ